MPTLWDRAAIDGLRSVVVNLPGTYPARRMNGSLVSGFVAPDLARACHPRTLGTRLSAEGYVIDVDAALADGDSARFSAHLVDVLRRRIQAMESMLDSERWSLGILAFTEANRLNRMWFRRIADGDGIERETYWRWFREVDSFVARCASRFASADIVVVSANGFGPLKRFVNLDLWLQANGYLNVGVSGATSPDSRAFSLDAGRIYIASSDMYPSGVVPRGDVRRLVDDIADGLTQLLDPDTGRPVIATVRKRRDAYEGARTYQGPNLVCLPAPGYELKSSRDRPLFSEAVFEGTHTQQDALLLATDTLARQGATVEDAGATVLAKLGLYHDDVDGSSLLS
jgi:predicted AlkP superfamily phosphohydrolase/phosphomutase